RGPAPAPGGAWRPRSRARFPARTLTSRAPHDFAPGSACAGGAPGLSGYSRPRLDICCSCSGAGRWTRREHSPEPRPDRRRSGGVSVNRSTRPLDVRGPHPYSHRRHMIPEQPLSLAVSPDLSLEALLALPPSPPAGVVICHPHPLYGGDMENPVVVRVQEACAALDLATLRFNFRGVGASGGVHGGGVGEQEDAASALDALAKAMGSGTPAIAGYSFGSRIAALVGSRDGRVGGIALLAPPLAVSDFRVLPDTPCPSP